MNIPLEQSVEQTLTLGTEWNREQLNDPASSGYKGESQDTLPGTKVISGLHFDYHSRFGSNYSPSFNLQQELGEMFSLKAGIARVFKAPNLY